MPQAASDGFASPSSPTTESGAGCLARAKGLFLLASAIGVGGLGWLMLRILANNLRLAPDHAERMRPFALWMIDHRAFAPLATAPVLAVAIWMMAKHRRTAKDSTASRRASPWIVFALASLWLLLVFSLLLVTFVQFLAPFYQYQEI